MHYLTETDLPCEKLTRRVADPHSVSELKIGVSTGEFLCKLASFYKERFFVGVELKSSSSRLAVKRILRRELSNVVVVNMEAHKYIKNWVSDCVFDVVHIYFPTPYPGSIGLPHRLIKSSFTREVHRILKPSGTLRIVTDDKDYYEEICSHLNSRHWWAVDWQPLELTDKKYLIGTRQEMVYRHTEHPHLYALQLIRI